MARNREKKALYEVMSKTQPKSYSGETLEHLHQEKFGEEDEQSASKFPARKPAKWLNRSIVQFNAGRIETSMPYQLAIALLLGLVLMLLVAFRLGQITYLNSRKVAGSALELQGNVYKSAPVMTSGAPQRATLAGEETPVLSSPPKTEPVKSKGDNRIVVQTYRIRADLEPVKQYFAQFGIETEIIKISDWYYLVTKEKYENPEKQGTDGYFAKQEIIELGAKYRAPPGYETFGREPFRDAYGKKFDE